jgi:hypothetical protein
MMTESEYDDIRRRVVVAWHEGDFDAASAGVEEVLGGGGTAEMKAECLLYRGMMRQGAGASAEARRDWAEALPHADEGTFLRFQLEQSMAEALGWCRRALQTCSGGDEFSGRQALVAYLRLGGGVVAPEDETLVASVVVKSWRVLELPGAPNVGDLPSAIRELTEAFATRVEEIVRGS